MSDVLRNAVNTFYLSSVAERVTTVSCPISPYTGDWASTIPWTREQQQDDLAAAKVKVKRLAQNYVNKLDDIDWWDITFTLGVGWKKALPSLWEELPLQGAGESRAVS